MACLRAAGDIHVEGTLDYLTNIDVHSHVGVSKSGSKVTETLAVIRDGLAKHLEGDDASLAVCWRLDQLKDANLVKAPLNVISIVARNQEHIVHGDVPVLSIADVVGKCNISLDEKLA